MIDGPVDFEDSELINCFEWATHGTRRLLDRKSKMLADECRERSKELRSMKSEMFSRACHILRTTFGLSKDAVALCELAAITKLYQEMERVLDHTLQIFTFKNRP